MKLNYYSILTLILMIISSFKLAAGNEHDHQCGIPPEEIKKVYKLQPLQTKAFDDNEIAKFPVKHWIIADDQGNHIVPVADFDRKMDLLNAAFLDAGIQFYSVGHEVYNNSNYSYFELSGGKDLELYNLIGNDDVINIFWTKTNGWSWARFPSTNPNSVTNYVVMNSEHTDQIFVHELGHTMGLLHTFQGSNELVDGSNCTSAGDLVCDTPADPKGSVDNNCNYNGTATDANGDLYNPMIENYMSYYPSNCQTIFTPGQLARARSFISYQDRLRLATKINQPTNLTASADVAAGKITLNWENTEVSPGTIEIEKTVEGITTIISIDPEATTYVDAEVSTTKWYSYKVRSNILGKTEDWSNSAHAKYANGGGCPGVVNWNSATAYDGGSIVVHNGIQYKAKWWTQGDNPSTNSSSYAVWEQIGTCPTDPIDPWSAVSNLVDGEQIYFLPSQPFMQKVEVNTNNDSIEIDSVRYIIVDAYSNYGNARRFTAKEFPFSIEFLPELSAYTEIYTVAYANGVANGTHHISVNFIEPAEPTLEILTPAEGDVVWIHQFKGLVDITVDLNTDETSIEKVEYEIAYIYTNHADVVRETVSHGDFHLSIVPKLCHRIEIIAVGIDQWNRATSLKKVTILPKDFTHDVTFISPTNNETIVMDVNNPQPIHVVTEIDNSEPILKLLWHAASYNNNGERTIFASSSVDQAPYEFDFTPPASDSIEIVVRTASYYGPGIEKAITVFVENPVAEELVITSPANGAVLGNQKGFDFTVDFSGIIDQVVSVDWTFTGPNSYSETRTITTAPFTIEWGFIELGDYTATAKAKTVNNSIITSDQIYLSVVQSVPTASITSPNSGASFTEGTMVDLEVFTQDLDGTIEYVEWFVNSGGPVPNTTIVSDSPFTLSRTDSPGTYTIWAYAIDNDGRAGFAQSITITITEQVGCSQPNWETSAAYNGGAIVSLNGVAYKAKWWTQGNNPESFSGAWDVWENLGDCNNTAPSFRKAVVESTLFPNPATEVVNVKTPRGSVVSIYNSVGNLIYQAPSEYQLQVNVSELNAGIYFVNIRSAEGSTNLNFVKK